MFAPLVPGLANSQHFVLELSAAHANEIGSLMIVFLAMPAPNSSLDNHAASLRSVGMLLEKRRSVAKAHGQSVLLLLTPKKGEDVSLASHISIECSKHAWDGSEKENQKRGHHLGAYKMALEEPISWGDCPDVRPQEAATPRSSISLWQKIAEVDSFDAEAWCREHTGSSVDKVSELTKIVTDFQDLIRLLAEKLSKRERGARDSERDERDVLFASPRASPLASRLRSPPGAHGVLASTGNLASPRYPTDWRCLERTSTKSLTRLSFNRTGTCIYITYE